MFFILFLTHLVQIKVYIFFINIFVYANIFVTFVSTKRKYDMATKKNDKEKKATKIKKQYNYSEIRTKRTSPLYVLVQPETEKELEEILAELGCTKTFLIEKLIKQEHERLKSNG